MMLVDAPYMAPSAPVAVSEQSTAVAQPAAARAIQRLTLLTFWLLIMEGALRKWVAPGASNLLFFIRDPFVLLIYWHALRGGYFKQPSAFLVMGLAFAAVTPFLAMAQISHVSDSRMVAVALYGWRQYFLYLPLPFVLARTLDQAFIWRLARHVFIATVLTAPLMFAQFHSPPSSVINRGSSDDEALQFKSGDLMGEKIRPEGFFTSTTGVNNLLPCAFAFVFAAWLAPASRRRPRLPMLLLAFVAIGTCLAVSGSRGAFAAITLVGLSCLLVGIVTPSAGTRVRALIIPSLLFGLGAALYPLLFPDAFETMMQRVTAADTFGGVNGGYGIFGRALYEIIDFAGVAQHAPLMGYGLGLGGNGHIFLGTLADQLLGDVYAESDWTRHIVDLGPVLGVLFIVYRIALTFSVFRQTLAATIRSRDPLPLLLFGYIGAGLFNGQLTGNGTIGGFLWLFLGVTLATCRTLPEPAGTAPQ